jgi:TonB family protein
MRSTNLIATTLLLVIAFAASASEPIEPEPPSGMVVLGTSIGDVGAGRRRIEVELVCEHGPGAGPARLLLNHAEKEDMEVEVRSAPAVASLLERALSASEDRRVFLERAQRVEARVSVMRPAEIVVEFDGERGDPPVFLLLDAQRTRALAGLLRRGASVEAWIAARTSDLSEALEPAGDAEPAPEASRKKVEEDRRVPVAEVTMRQMGRPLAAAGLRIQTVRPRFSQRTSLTAAPKPVVVRIGFRADGAVKTAIVEESSGDPEIDRPIIDAVYRWRAAGGALEDVKANDPDGVVEIAVRFTW